MVQRDSKRKIWLLANIEEHLTRGGGKKAISSHTRPTRGNTVYEHYRTLQSYDGEGNENVNRINKQTKTSHEHHPFLSISLAPPVQPRLSEMTKV